MKKRWSREEEKMLGELYKTSSNKDISKKLMRTKNSIRSKASRINLKKCVWSDEDNKYLMKNYKYKSYREMRKELGKTKDSILQRLSWLKLKKTPEEKGRIRKRVFTDYSYITGKNSPGWKGGKPVGKCKLCGKKFIGEHGNPNKFCSVSCASLFNRKFGKDNNFWNGGEMNWKKKKYLYSSNEWAEIRKKIIKRDCKCDICGSKESLVVHHKIKYKDGGKNIPNNLITLCKNCHSKLHTLERFYNNNYSYRDYNRLANELRKKDVC